MNTIKLVMVGDVNVGKTSLCISYDTKEFSDEYVPIIFWAHAESISVGTEIWTFSIWDTAGQAEHDRLRPLSYPQTDVFVACFSVGLPTSLESIKGKWFPEVRHYCPGVPCLLVATQIDLRSDQKVVEKMARLGQLPLSLHEGLKMAREVGATQYLECSAKIDQGVEDIFTQAVKVAVATKTANLQRRKRKCIVL
ncbi:P-loop containing nucleoside triphosphate hydrolase protein [Mycena capillaripes]|nr:P-loop containing nucleoside triphosphate hydrolase protein [Mycena capillaripes]